MNVCASYYYEWVLLQFYWWSYSIPVHNLVHYSHLMANPSSNKIHTKLV